MSDKHEELRRARLRRIGFGVSGPLASFWHSEREAADMIARALAAGVRFFDTAGFYGGGLGERRLGRALKGRDDVIVAAKTGTRVDRFGRRHKDFSKAAIRADVEASLKRLGRERLDIVYLHGPSRYEMRWGLFTLQQLKEQGLVGRAGVCADGPRAHDAVMLEAEALMAPYSFMNKLNAEALAAAKCNGAHTVAIAPLAQALYADGFERARSVADAWKIARARRKSPELLAHARAVSADLSAAVAPLSTPAAALAYAVDVDDIDVSIITTTKPAHLGALMDAARAPLPAGARAALEAFGDKAP